MIWRLLLLVLAAAFALASCGASKDDDIRQWLVEQRNAARPKAADIAAPKQFKPESYTSAGAVDPFSVQKLAQGLKGDTASNAGLVAPELARRKEPLEALALEAIAMVGSLIREGKAVALVKAEGLLYQVKVGNYLGQNYGRITKITETEVTLREITQDALGEWIERAATLQLQEKAK